MDEFSTQDNAAIDPAQKHLNSFEYEIKVPGASKTLKFHYQDKYDVFEKIDELDKSRSKALTKDMPSSIHDYKIEDHEENKIVFNWLEKSLSPSLSKRSILDKNNIKILVQSRVALLVDLTQNFKDAIQSLWDDMAYELDVASNKRELRDTMKNMVLKNNKSYKIIFVVFNPHLFEEISELVRFIREFETETCINPSKIWALGIQIFYNSIVWENDKTMVVSNREFITKYEIYSQSSMDNKSMMLNIPGDIYSVNSHEEQLINSGKSISLLLRQAIEVSFV